MARGSPVAAAPPERPRPPDDGQVTLLIVCFAVIVLLLIVVAVNASKVFLAERDLGAAADAASAAAAQAVAEAAVYEGPPGELLPIDPAGASAAVGSYLDAAKLAERFEGLRVVAVTTDGATVTVTLAASVAMPFGSVLPGGEHSYGISATASARSPLR
jgi:hypothetical protein